MTYRLVANLGVVAALHSQDTNSSLCFVRLMHELKSNANNIAVRYQLQNFASTAYHAISAYSSVPCPSLADNWLIVDSQSGLELATVPLPTSKGPATYSILVMDSATTSAPTASIFPDIVSALPDNPNSVSNAAVRVINGYSSADGSGSGVHVYGVTKECYKCAMPFLFTVQPGQAFGSTSNWGDWFMAGTEYGLHVEIVPAKAGVTPLPFIPSLYNDVGVYMQGQIPRQGYTGWAKELLLNEHGVYTVIVHDGESVSWDLVGDVQGQNQWLPLLWAALALVGMGVLYHVVAFGVANAAYGTAIGNALADNYEAIQLGLKNKRSTSDVTLLSFLGFDTRIARLVLKERNKRAADYLKEGLLPTSGGAVEAVVGAAAPTTAAGSVVVPSHSSGRFRSLDAFRGLSLTIMCFVNYGAGNYSMLDHSAWNGLHLADLVFPWFVFMSGVSMAISFDSARRKGASRAELSWKVTVRAMKLFALGLFLNNGATIAQWRIIGVLQYFSVSNLIVGNVEAWLHPTHTPTESNSGKGAAKDLWLTVRRDVGQYWVQWSVMSVLMLIYLVIQGALPLPEGCPTGYRGPGGLTDNGQYYGLGCTGGAHRVVDYMLFGANHIYHGVDGTGTPVSAATCAGPYACDVHDPEGALGWITAAWQVWMGLQAGRVLVHYKAEGVVPGTAGVDTRKLVRPYLTRLTTWGSVSCLLGGALCSFAAEGGALPINKNLWSPSFIIVLSGLGTLILAFLWWVIDHHRVWSGSPWRYVGMNSIAFYVLHETYGTFFPFGTYINAPGWGDPYGSAWYSHGEALGSNLAGVCCWIAVMRFLYLKKVFINF